MLSTLGNSNQMVLYIEIFSEFGEFVFSAFSVENPYKQQEKYHNINFGG